MFITFLVTHQFGMAAWQYLIDTHCCLLLLVRPSTLSRATQLAGQICHTCKLLHHSGNRLWHWKRPGWNTSTPKDYITPPSDPFGILFHHHVPVLVKNEAFSSVVTFTCSPTSYSPWFKWPTPTRFIRVLNFLWSPCELYHSPVPLPFTTFTTLKTLELTPRIRLYGTT